MKDFGSAFFVAAAMTAAGWPLSMPIQMAETSLIELLTGSAGPSLQLTGWWLFSWSWLVFAGFTFAENFILFLAIILMTLIDLFVPLALVNVAGPFVAY